MAKLKDEIAVGLRSVQKESRDASVLRALEKLTIERLIPAEKAKLTAEFAEARVLHVLKKHLGCRIRFLELDLKDELEKASARKKLMEQEYVKAKSSAGANIEGSKTWLSHARAQRQERVEDITFVLDNEVRLRGEDGQAMDFIRLKEGGFADIAYVERIRVRALMDLMIMSSYRVSSDLDISARVRDLLRDHSRKDWFPDGDGLDRAKCIEAQKSYHPPRFRKYCDEHACDEQMERQKAVFGRAMELQRAARLFNYDEEAKFFTDKEIIADEAGLS
jgi:hypothetical protein